MDPSLKLRFTLERARRASGQDASPSTVWHVAGELEKAGRRLWSLRRMMVDQSNARPPSFDGRSVLDDVREAARSLDARVRLGEAG